MFNGLVKQYAQQRGQYHKSSFASKSLHGSDVPREYVTVIISLSVSALQALAVLMGRQCSQAKTLTSVRLFPNIQPYLTLYPLKPH